MIMLISVEYEQIEIVTHSRPNSFGKKKVVEEEEEQSGAIVSIFCSYLNSSNDSA
jgi:hypothetical protein